MNAIITQDGTLIVSPENEIEAYVLKKWSDNFMNQQGFETLSIQTELHKEQPKPR